MNNQAQLEKSIRMALLQGVETLEADMDCLERIKSRIDAEKKESKEMKKRLHDYFYNLKFNINKTAALACTLTVALALMCTFVQPIRVLAQEGIDTVTSMVWTVVKGENGKYQPVQVPAEGLMIAITSGSTTALKDEELAKEVGFDVKAPQTLEGGYGLEYAAVNQTDETDIKTIAKFYKKEKSTLALSITDQDYFLRYARETGDNRKEVRVEDKTLYYYESPLPVHPLVKENGVTKNDITQQPTEIKTVHSLAWEHNGVYYKLDDMGDVLPLDELENAAKSVVQYQIAK